MANAVKIIIARIYLNLK